MWRYTSPPDATACPMRAYSTQPTARSWWWTLDPDADPPKLLAIGPDLAGNLLEVIVVELADDRLMAIHAMPLRPMFHDLLPTAEDPDG